VVLFTELKRFVCFDAPCARSPGHKSVTTRDAMIESDGCHRTTDSPSPSLSTPRLDTKYQHPHWTDERKELLLTELKTCIAELFPTLTGDGVLLFDRPLDATRLQARELVMNGALLRCMIAASPDRSIPASWLADCFAKLDEWFDFKLSGASNLRAVATWSIKEAVKGKQLLGYLRRLASNSRVSRNRRLRELKALIRFRRTEDSQDSLLPRLADSDCSESEDNGTIANDVDSCSDDDVPTKGLAPLTYYVGLDWYGSLIRHEFCLAPRPRRSSRRSCWRVA